MRVQLWEGVRTECWERLDEEEATDKSVKRFIRKVMDKRRRWMDPGKGQ